MSGHIINDADDRINEIPNVRFYYPETPQPRDGIWGHQLGKGTLSSLFLVWVVYYVVLPLPWRKLPTQGVQDLSLGYVEDIVRWGLAGVAYRTGLG